MVGKTAPANRNTLFTFTAPICQLPLANHGAVEQIVGRERRERISQLAWCGEGCFDSRRRVNSIVMQLIVSKKGFRDAASLCLVAGILFVAACHKGKSPKISSPVRVSLCDLYENPAAYDGRLITITATITQLQDGKYLYPGPSNECGYSFIKVDVHNFRNTGLDELESSAASSTGRKEFDLEL